MILVAWCLFIYDVITEHTLHGTNKSFHTGSLINIKLNEDNKKTHLH